MKRAALLVVVLCGCGIDQPSNPAVSKTSQALHCDTEATLNANGSATKLSCPFEQQFRNIKANGTPSTAQLLSNAQPVALTASMTCNQWVMGTDASGATVFVSTSDGSVLSHGAVHAGYPLSVLPATLQLPLTFAP